MSETEKKVKLPHRTMPVEFHTLLDKLTLTLYKLSKASSAKDLKEKNSGLPSPITIGRGLSYLEYLGVVKRSGGKGIYELTDDGREIGIQLYQQESERANRIWKTILENHPMYTYIQNYIQEKGGGVRGSSIGLAEYLRDLASANWKTSFLKMGGERLCNLFAAKGLLVFDEEEDSISLPPEMKPSKPPSQPPAAPPSQLPEGEVTVPPPAPQQPLTAPSSALFNVDVQLKIEISKDTTPELAAKIFDFLLELRERGEQITFSQKETKKD